MARRPLGQHFLLDPNILKRIVAAAGLSPEDVVVEIGPGLGRLTAMLADKASRVVAIELDERLYEGLRDELSGIPSVELVHGDALTYSYERLGDFKVVANIPYYITTPLIFALLKHRGRMRSMTIMVQKEVGERIVAQPGGKSYGVLSIAVQYHAKTEMKFIVPRGAFRPVPKVDSALIHMEVCNEPVVRVTDDRLFFQVVRAAFSQRRKMLSNSLKPLTGDIRRVLLGAGIEPSRRPETLTIEEFARLSEVLKKERL